jgi:myo-inositol-1(or 4)-monophosphatase
MAKTETALSASPTLDEDYALLTGAVRDVGQLANTYFRQPIKVKRKPDGTEVSEADLAVDTALKLVLGAARPDYGWLSEETEDNGARLHSKRVWVVDPIDGTRSFLRHIPEWTVAAALVEDGVPLIGVVYNPAQDEFFAAVRGRGTTLNGEPVTVSDQAAIEGAHLIATSGLLKKKFWAEPWPEVDVRWVNSVAYRLALVAAGKADATISLSAKSDWDLAAAALLVEEAGGYATDHRGEPLRYNLDLPRHKSLVAAPPKLHRAIVARTQSLEL